MKERPIDSAKAEMRRGMLEYCILLVISQGETYATGVLKSLKGAGLIVVEGTIYPLLNRLRGEGLLEHAWEESKSGPPRKYYSLTADGRARLAELKASWRSLVGSVDSLLKN